jgi:hypothetical protein
LELLFQLKSAVQAREVQGWGGGLPRVGLRGRGRQP